MKSMLCIDIGGSRIKAAVLPEQLDADKLPGVSVVAIRALGWLNQSMPEIISVKNWAAVVNQKQLSDQYSEIAICVPGPVRDGEFCRPDLDVPRDLLQEFKRSTDKPVRLFNDAVAWTTGAVAYSRLMGEPLHLPAIALAFGTGVGLSVACDKDRMLSVEISKWPGASLFWNKRVVTQSTRLGLCIEFWGTPSSNGWPARSVTGRMTTSEVSSPNV